MDRLTSNDGFWVTSITVFITNYSIIDRQTANIIWFLLLNVICNFSFHYSIVSGAGPTQFVWF